MLIRPGISWYSVEMTRKLSSMSRTPRGQWAASLAMGLAMSIATSALTACSGSQAGRVEAPGAQPDKPAGTATGRDSADRPEAYVLADVNEFDQLARDTAAPDAAPREGPAEVLEMAFVGDVMFGRWREEGLKAIDFRNVDIFGPMQDLMASDFTIANLETPLVYDIPEEPPYGTRLRFAAPPQAARAMRRAGIHAVNLANNHSFDMKFIGLRETPKILAEEGFGIIGQSRSEEPIFRIDQFDIQGWKVGFLAATEERNGPQRKNAPELPYLYKTQVAKTLAPIIRQARSEHDLLIVILHWGLEYKERPANWQIKAARALIDAGADAVIAHHPHVLQAIERYKNGLIAYSIGNFVFDNTSAALKLTGVLRLRFQRQGKCLERAVFHPAYVTRQPTHHPLPANKAMRKLTRGRVIKLSRDKPFRTEWKPEGRDLVLAEPPCPANDGD